MKYLIIHLICILFGAQLASGAPVQLQRTVPQPPYPGIVKNPQTTAFKLKALLDAGKLEEFYQEADQYLKNIDEEYGKQLDKEKLHDRLWLFYYVAAAPFFAMDDDPDEVFPWFKSRYQDHWTKFRASSCTAHPEKNSSDKETQLFISLSAAYCAQIIGDMRRAYDPDLEKRQPAQEEQFLEKNRKLFTDKKLTYEQFERRIKLFRHRASTMENRNSMVKNNILFIEKDFISMLTRYFSGNAGKARQYIKQAGYADKEIPDLLNRTAGRGAATEFLYKGTGKSRKSS